MQTKTLIKKSIEFLQIPFSRLKRDDQDQAAKDLKF